MLTSRGSEARSSKSALQPMVGLESGASASKRTQISGLSPGGGATAGSEQHARATSRTTGDRFMRARIAVQENTRQSKAGRGLHRSDNNVLGLRAERAAAV